MHPRVRAALCAQLERRRALLAGGAQRVGWKLAYGIPELDAVTGGDPVIGYLTSATVIAPGGAFGADGVRELCAETELLVVDGEPGVALELVDVGRPPADLEGIVAENVLHRAVVLGAVAAGLRPGARARILVGGEVREEVEATGDPAAVTRAVAAQLAELGEELRPGDRILAGSLTHVPVAAGDHVRAEIDGFGALEVTIT